MGIVEKKTASQTVAPEYATGPNGQYEKAAGWLNIEVQDDEGNFVSLDTKTSLLVSKAVQGAVMAAMNKDIEAAEGENLQAKIGVAMQKWSPRFRVSYNPTVERKAPSFS